MLSFLTVNALSISDVIIVVGEKTKVQAKFRQTLPLGLNIHISGHHTTEMYIKKSCIYALLHQYYNAYCVEYFYIFLEKKSSMCFCQPD